MGADARAFSDIVRKRITNFENYRPPPPADIPAPAAALASMHVQLVPNPSPSPEPVLSRSKPIHTLGGPDNGERDTYKPKPMPLPPKPKPSKSVPIMAFQEPARWCACSTCCRWRGFWRK